MYMYKITNLLNCFNYFTFDLSIIPLPERATSLHDSLYVFGACLVDEFRLTASLQPPKLRQSQVDPPQRHADHEIVAQRDDLRELEHTSAPSATYPLNLMYTCMHSACMYRCHVDGTSIIYISSYTISSPVMQW